MYIVCRVSSVLLTHAVCKAIGCLNDKKKASTTTTATTLKPTTRRPYKTKPIDFLFI